MKKYLLPVFLLGIFHLGIAQKEANIWHFGVNACIDFNSGPPISLGGSALATQEGSSSICDPHGNLLFYSDGSTVWNKNNTILPGGTGLGGHPSSTQAALLVPQPGNDSIYYLFTNTDCEITTSPGFQYAIINKNLDGGNGAVISGPTDLGIGVNERATATVHANGTDIWITSGSNLGNTYYSFLLTSAGLNTTPVINTVGPLVHCHGYLKTSPSGKRMAVAAINAKIVLFDFNNATGIMSNPVTLDGFSDNSPYSVEFSPDETKLYANSWDSNNALYQYDLQAGNQTQINNSFIIITKDEPYTSNISAMQLGPDQRIYIVRSNHAGLDVINNPNASGLLCNYQRDGVILHTGFGYWGITNIYHRFVQPIFTWIYSCSWEPAYFSIQNTSGLISTNWNFGDPSSGSANTSTQVNPSHIFTEPGTYPVTLIADYGSHLDTAKEYVTIYYTDSLCNPDDQEFVPLAFSPNGDGNNDVLYVRGDNISTMHFVVYDMWGQIVFETTDEKLGWDGKVKSLSANPGTFAWKLEMLRKGTSEPKIKNGKVVLIK